MIDEFHGRSAVGGVHIHLRGIQRAQRRTHALGDVGRVFDAFAARLQLLVLPRLRVGSVDAVDGFAQVVGLLAAEDSCERRRSSRSSMAASASHALR